ncbi:methyltransferase [Sphingomonas sp.]|uniref:class I SAM-dependent methyltransferase n=1 Tax=Sphingomonas sp. TaxID=28214 RepID=UPI002CC13FF4|nr:methyltransferase [Sphingomonas sp.]HTG39844.1 methyltransferase [Sphingomonas sp.]
MTPLSTTQTRRAARRRHGAPSPWGMFLKGFVKHPLMVGSIVPSSDKLIARMLGPVDWANTRLFIEYGPGVGTFSRAILDQMAADATYLAIDTNIDFVRYLRQTVRDDRMRVVHGSAADVCRIVADHGFSHADYVLSGLPFSTLPTGVGDMIADQTARVIRPGGAFLVYQFSPKVRDLLHPRFASIDHAFEWWNMPPAHLYWAHVGAAAETR